MYVYQISERDWLNTKPHLTIQLEEFCHEIKIFFSIFTILGTRDIRTVSSQVVGESWDWAEMVITLPAVCQAITNTLNLSPCRLCEEKKMWGGARAVALSSTSLWWWRQQHTAPTALGPSLVRQMSRCEEFCCLQHSSSGTISVPMFFIKPDCQKHGIVAKVICLEFVSEEVCQEVVEVCQKSLGLLCGGLGRFPSCVWLQERGALNMGPPSLTCPVSS